MEFKVGQRVRIKQYNDIVNSDTFEIEDIEVGYMQNDMSNIAGKVYTIAYVGDNLIELENHQFCWHPNWVKPIIRNSLKRYL